MKGFRYEARAPLRIDFGGGWTDVPAYALQEGGAVLNAAITCYARGSITRGKEQQRWLNRRSESDGVSYHLDLSSGSGLGTSAAQTLLWVTLVRSSFANTASRVELAEMACEVAATLGIVGGKQDEYASALGGIHYFSFEDRVEPQRLDLSSTILLNLRTRLVLADSGDSRVSADIHGTVWERYRSGDSRVTAALRELKRLAGDMRHALIEEKMDDFGRLLSENWEAQKALHPSVTTSALDSLFDLALHSGAVGGKACGAGGGGCVVFAAAEGHEDRLRDALGAAGALTIPFDFDTYGVYLTKG